MAVVNTYHQMIALRLIVGLLEAGFAPGQFFSLLIWISISNTHFAPGVLLILSSWYKKNEQSKRFAVFISAAVLSGALGGILAGAITNGLNGAHGYVLHAVVLNTRIVLIVTSGLVDGDGCLLLRVLLLS
jgi:MFS family permease